MKITNCDNRVVKAITEYGEIITLKETADLHFKIADDVEIYCFECCVMWNPGQPIKLGNTFLSDSAF